MNYAAFVLAHLIQSAFMAFSQIAAMRNRDTVGAKYLRPFFPPGRDGIRLWGLEDGAAGFNRNGVELGFSQPALKPAGVINFTAGCRREVVVSVKK